MHKVTKSNRTGTYVGLVQLTFGTRAVSADTEDEAKARVEAHPRVNCTLTWTRNEDGSLTGE